MNVYQKGVSVVDRNFILLRHHHHLNAKAHLKLQLLLLFALENVKISFEQKKDNFSRAQNSLSRSFDDILDFSIIKSCSGTGSSISFVTSWLGHHDVSRSVESCVVCVCIVFERLFEFLRMEHVRVGPQCAALHAIQILDCRYQFWGAKQSTKLGFFPTLFAICRSLAKNDKNLKPTQKLVSPGNQPSLLLLWLLPVSFCFFYKPRCFRSTILYSYSPTILRSLFRVNGEVIEGFWFLENNHHPLW